MNISWFDTLDGGNSDIRADDDGVLYIMYAHMGNETLLQVNKIGTGISTKIVYEEDSLMDYYAPGYELDTCGVDNSEPLYNLKR